MSGPFGIDLFNAIGIVGVALYLASYAALQIGLLRGQGYTYAAINLAAASCVLISLTTNFNLSSALIQVSWITISIVGMLRLYYIHRRMRFSPQEREMLEIALPNLPREQARALLDLGLWINGQPGTVLTVEHQPVRHLIFLAEGEACVISGGTVIAGVSERSFIGEITCLTGMPASGTVQLTSPSFYFAIEAETLRSFLAKRPQVRDMLELAFADQLRNKLVALNKSVAERERVYKTG